MIQLRKKKETSEIQINNKRKTEWKRANFQSPFDIAPKRMRNDLKLE